MYSLKDFFDKPENRKYKGRYELAPLTLPIFNYIGSPVNIHSIIQAISSNRPAIEGLIPGLENTFFMGTLPEDMFKQMIGSMIKYFISDLGYETTDKVPTLKAKNNVFKSGTKYTFNPARATKELKISYEIIDLKEKHGTY